MRILDDDHGRRSAAHCVQERSEEPIALDDRRHAEVVCDLEERAEDTRRIEGVAPPDTQEPPDAVHGLPPTLAIGIRLIEITPLLAMQFGGWHPIPIAIITFAQSLITNDFLDRVRCQPKLLICPNLL